MYVGLSRGSWERSFKSSPELYHTVQDQFSLIVPSLGLNGPCLVGLQRFLIPQDIMQWESNSAINKL